MPTLREYLTKHISAIAARSSLGPKLRTIAQTALLPALGDTEMEKLTNEEIVAFGEKRLKEPKKDGSSRSQASVEQEMTALEDVVKHFHGGKGTSAGKSAAAAIGPEKKAAGPSGPAPAGKPKMTRGTNRGR